MAKQAREIVCIAKGSPGVALGDSRLDARAREGGGRLFSGVSGDRPVWQFVKRFIKCVDLYRVA